MKYQKPMDIESKYGNRKVFRIIVNVKEHAFTVNGRSPLYRILVSRLADAECDVKVVLVRTGNGKLTKYDVKES